MPSEPKATSHRPTTHESPSLQAAECLDQHPATGLRLPPRRREAEPLHVTSGTSAGGEQRQDTLTVTSWASIGAPATGAAVGGPTGLVSEGRLEPEPTDPDGVGWTLRDDECPLEGALAFDHTTGEVAWRPTCKNARCRRCSRQVSAQTFALARRAVDPLDRVRFHHAHPCP